MVDYEEQRRNDAYNDGIDGVYSTAERQIESYREAQALLKARIEELEDNLADCERQLHIYQQVVHGSDNRLVDAEEFIIRIVRENRGRDWADAYQFPEWVYEQAVSYCERYGIKEI